MSEGRTPNATLTQQRRLEQEDVDILHQIVIRAQNDPISQEQPRDALLQAYGEIFDERHLNQHQDRACFNVLLKLLNPVTPGESLYHKFEHILQEDGIALSYEDDATTQDSIGEAEDPHSDGTSNHIRAPSMSVPRPRRHSYQPTKTDPSGTQQATRHDYYPTQSIIDVEIAEAQNDVAYINNTPPQIAQLLQQAELRDMLVLTRQTLDVWRDSLQAVRERQMEARAEALYNVRLKQKVLKQCIAVFQDIQHSQVRADHIYRHRLVRNPLSKICDEYRVRRVASIDDDRIKGLSLYKWTLASRETSFAHNRDHQLKAAFMRKLFDTYRASRAKQAQLEQMLQARQVYDQAALVRSAFSFIAKRTNQAEIDHAKADTHNRNTLCYASINAWRLKTGRLNELGLTAEDAREYFLMKRVLRQLRNITRFRKERRWWLATWTSRKWQDHVRSQKHARYDDAYRQMRRTIKVNLGKRMLLQWQQKVLGHREDDSRADAIYRASIQQRIMRPMIESTYDTANWVKDNEQIADARATQLLQQRAVVAIQMRQQSLLDMNDKADRLRQYRTEQRAVQGLRQMQMKAFGLQRRHYDADAFRDRNDKRAVRNILARLRRALAERRAGDEGALALIPPPAVTPARKREVLLLNSSTRLSTTPAYTPFAVRLTQEPRVLEDIEDLDEDIESAQHYTDVENDS